MVLTNADLKITQDFLPLPPLNNASVILDVLRLKTLEKVRGGLPHIMDFVLGDLLMRLQGDRSLGKSQIILNQYKEVFSLVKELLLSRNNTHTIELEQGVSAVNVRP